MSLVFFTDRDLGRAFPRILREAGIKTERHDDHFAPDTRDEDWLRMAGERGWYAITCDGRIRYKPNERDAVMDSGIGLFVMIGRMTHPQHARTFVNTFRRVESFIAKHRRPFIAKIYGPSGGGEALEAGHPGRVTLHLAHDDWKDPQTRTRSD